jgi:methionyl-tRNA synthetase
MEKIIFENPWIILLILVWTLPWKAVALWLSARRSQKGWFIVILLLNTLGILEIIYIFFFSNRKIKKQEQEEVVQFHQRSRNRTV